MSAWTDHVARWKDCRACPLCHQRDRICLARGSLPCDILFVGEAPGASEDALGQPFVGPAGKLLDQIIERSFAQWQVPGTEGQGHNSVRHALTNLVCCFPAEAKARGDNEPTKEEILACRPRLVEFVNISRPRLIVCVGALATQYVDHSDTIPCCDIVHPAHILRKDVPLAKKQALVTHITVILRSAVEKVMDGPSNEFKIWGSNYANFSKGLRQRYDTFVNSDADIPF